MAPRVNFSIKVKKALAHRAGYRCSICNRLTVGPSAESKESVNLTGVAAHIAAAAAGGRRYHDLPTDSKERCKIINGIWLCTTHSDLVDGDEIYFTSEVLKEYKRKHESRVSLEHKGLKIENGLITKVDISNLGSIRNEVVLEFENKNIIFGANGTGKTLICEMIAALTDKKYLNRWSKYEWDKSNSYCHVYYYRNDISRFGIYINSKNELSYSYDDREIPFVKAPFSVFYITLGIYKFRDNINKEREDTDDPEVGYEDTLSWLSLYFNLSVSEFTNVINSMSKERKFFINDIRVNHSKKDIEVIYWGGKNDNFHQFSDFSEGEKQRIILDIILRIATYYAKFQTTMLLLESTAIGTIDQEGINEFLEIINNQDLGFQFLFTSQQKPNYFKSSGYCVHELEFKKPTTVGNLKTDMPVIVNKL